MLERTPNQICEETLAKFTEEAREKFHEGQEEHGGNLDERVTVKDVKMEAIDIVFYVYTLERKVEEMELQLKFFRELSKR